MPADDAYFLLASAKQQDRCAEISRAVLSKLSPQLQDLIAADLFKGTAGTRFGGPGADIWDTRLSKLTPLRENVNLRFLAEFFNTWNHAAFGNPNSILDTATFGTINFTLSNARIIQLGLKLEY